MIDGELMPEEAVWNPTKKDLPAFVSACLTGEMSKYRLGDLMEVAETLTTREEMLTFIRSYNDMLVSQNKDFGEENLAYLVSECVSDSFRYTWEEAFYEVFGRPVDEVVDAMLDKAFP